MRLRKLRLSGFKSFVDPTSIELPSDLIGVVGPNGCGKSNIIDAVRWVMGEVSAKHLRGDTMADVVFTGSNTRKPVSQASVELVFDNSDGRIGGQYAGYAEIAVKRQISRDSQSSYFLNGARCRRKDITDIFQGTGLGPRSYAIIEQGMISRIIEAKPDELREFIEEAAGISKYKERRRETETRIRNTQENLDRLTDIREELGKRLQHLKRQSTMAEKYQVLKGEERQLRAEALALNWRVLDRAVQERQEQVNIQEVKLESVLAEQRSVETRLETRRVDHTAAGEEFNTVYRQVLDAGANIARNEEAIQSLRRRQDELRESLGRERGVLDAGRESVGTEQLRRADLHASLSEQQPRLAQLQQIAAVAEAGYRTNEQSMREWQARFEELSEQAVEPARVVHAEQARIQYLEENLARRGQQLAKLEAEQRSLDRGPASARVAELGSALGHSETRLNELTQTVTDRQIAIRRLRDEQREQSGALHDSRDTMQNLRGRLASLQALQQDALGKGPGKVREWLIEQGLVDNPRLVEQIQVESGWELALELALGEQLEAVCIDELDRYGTGLAGFADGSMSLIGIDTDTTESTFSQPWARLADRVSGPYPVAGLLQGVYVAASLEEALSRRRLLRAGESLITADGIWLGRQWLRIHRPSQEETGILAREQELKLLAAEFSQAEALIETQERQLRDVQSALQATEDEHADAQGRLANGHQEYASMKGELETERARLVQLNLRVERVASEISELRAANEVDDAGVAGARNRLKESSLEVERLTGERETWEAQRQRLRGELDAAQNHWQSVRDEAYEAGLRVESLTVQLAAVDESLTRYANQVDALVARCDELEKLLVETESPIARCQSDLEQALILRSQLDNSLLGARTLVEEIEADVRNLDSHRQLHETQVLDERNGLEQYRMQSQEVLIRRKTVEEQFAALDYVLTEVLASIDEEARVEDWEQKVEAIDKRIARLGPINLAAIEEFDQQSERKQYLDAQHADLEEALATLSAAIQKIDRETRSRFRETYDKINIGLGNMFPRLFGGGNACLEMTGDDLLSTGIAVMAHPPGKRNSSIHLLSGGEKALTAVAMVFAIFELNPAPFCLLDEVDAPLDDVNVARFCELVKEMSERIQFIIVTHNKVTMEITQQLIGVTMNEPGVSRLVAVDVDEAVELVAV